MLPVFDLTVVTPEPTDPPWTTCAEARAAHSVDARPEPEYEHTVTIRRPVVETGVFRYVSNDDAPSTKDVYSQLYYADVDWDSDSYGPDEVVDVTTTCLNEDEVAEWDDTYGDYYDHDGDPLCPTCRIAACVCKCP